MSDARAYHESELAIARSAGDPRRSLPTIPEGARRILDIGCGAGQSLIGLALPPSILAVGLDRDVGALTLGQNWTDRVAFVGAAGETLPFADGAFDFLFARVALPYMHIPSALAEMHRVLAPGGAVWLAMHPPRMTFAQLAKAVRSLHLKSAVFQSYAALNGALYHFTGRMLAWPAGAGRYESFQTSRISARLRGAGFTDVELEPEPHFTVRARKP